MKLDTFLTSSVLLALIGSTNGYPGGKHGSFAATFEEIKRRAAAPIAGPLDSNELIGDLLTVGPKSEVGKVRSLQRFCIRKLTRPRQ
jgi:hypothetical protein